MPLNTSSPGSSQKPMEARHHDLQRRFVEISQRFYPFLRMKEGYSVFRPLIHYNGCDVLRTVEEESIPILGIPCSFKDS